MTHGFKDKNKKFHPITNYKSRQKRSVDKLQGVRLKLEDFRSLRPFHEIATAPRKKDPIRIRGNEIINNLVDVLHKSHPEKSNFKIHNENIYNSYDEIQKTFYYAEESVNLLLHWRNDKNPKTWKWLIPIILDSPNKQSDFIIEDDHNNGFIGDAYKGRVSIAIMSPRNFLHLASPKLDPDNPEGFDKKAIDDLANKMKAGKPIDTPFLQVKDENQVRSHEGRHRALGAIKAGISQIPVYIYTDEPMNTTQREQFSLVPFKVLKPDRRMQ